MEAVVAVEGRPRWFQALRMMMRMSLMRRRSRASLGCSQVLQLCVCIATDKVLMSTCTIPALFLTLLLSGCVDQHTKKQTGFFQGKPSKAARGRSSYSNEGVGRREAAGGPIPTTKRTPRASGDASSASSAAEAASSSSRAAQQRQQRQQPAAPVQPAEVVTANEGVAAFEKEREELRRRLHMQRQEQLKDGQMQLVGRCCLNRGLNGVVHSCLKDKTCAQVYSFAYVCVCVWLCVCVPCSSPAIYSTQHTTSLHHTTHNHTGHVG